MTRSTTTMPRHRTTTALRQDGGEGLRVIWTGGGPKRVSFGPGMFFFLHPLFLTNIYTLFTRRQAYGPTLAAKASRWAVLRLTNPTLATSASRWGFPLVILHTAHPRCKREPVGRIYTHRPHPRSKRESVGSFSTHTAHTAHPRCKRESVDRFCTTSDPRTPPSLQTRVGGVLSYIRPPE
jgi:hypothetical protein